MEGGRLLAQGTYGCIFDPPLQCESDGRKKAQGKGRDLGKITLKRDFVIEEEAAIRIRKIPNYLDYFLPIDVTTKCRPEPVKDQTDPDIWKCGYLRKEGYDVTDSVHVKLKYGGIDSHHFVCDPVLEDGCELPKKPLNWSMFMEHLLEAGAVLTLNQLVHYDIHRSNILVDPKTMKPRFIDFGQTFFAGEITNETLKERWKLIYPNQRQRELEPPEVTMAAFIRKGFSSVEAYAQMMRYKEPLQKVETMLGLSRQTQGREFAEFWRDSGAAKSGDWVRMFKFYWPTFDAWNIGAVLLHLLEYCYYKKEVATSGEFRAAESRFKEVLRGLLRMSPKRRLDCVEALNLWNPNNKIIQTDKAQEWLDARTKQRSG
jgi:hypothetical protein